MFIIDSDDSENDADAEIIELPPEIISTLKEKTIYQLVKQEYLIHLHKLFR